MGLVLIGDLGRRRALWRGLACELHADELLAARALRPRDQAMLARRREAWHTRLAGRPWHGQRNNPGLRTWSPVQVTVLRRASG